MMFLLAKLAKEITSVYAIFFVHLYLIILFINYGLLSTLPNGL